jgi:hypothetical protein
LNKHQARVAASFSGTLLLAAICVTYVAIATPAFAQVAEEVLVCHSIDSTIDPQPVVVEDQFGAETVDPRADTLRGFALLCINAIKNGPTPPIVSFFWTVYLIDGTIDPPIVTLNDQFGSDTADLGPSSALFVPAVTEGSPVSSGRHWTAYPHGFGGINPPPVLVSSGFGSEILDPAASLALLVPSQKDGHGDLTAPHLRCYIVGNAQIDPDRLEVEDQFGNEVVDPGTARFLCIPTVKQIGTPVGGEILGTDMTTLLVAGAAANVSWLIPILAGVTAAGIIGYITTRRFM